MTYLFSNTSSIFQSNGTAITTENPLAVTVGGANITIQGNTNVISNVAVTNFPSVQAVTGNVNATVIGSITVSGITSNINVNPITGTVNASILIGGNIVSNSNPIPVTGNVGISGNVNVNPITGNVVVTAIGNLNVTGNTLPVSGNVNATILINGSIVSNANPFPISGNVGITGNVTVGSITGNVNVNPITGTVNANILVGGNIVSNANPIPISGNVTVSGTANVVLADDANVVISGFSGATSDAFGRLRVSDPYTLFDTQARYFDHGQFASNITGTGNVTFLSNQSSFQLSVGSSSGDSVLRETVKTFVYQPGKSQLSLNTFCFATPKTNLRQRVGLFSTTNGVYFENDGTYNYLVIRSSSTGVEERIRQDYWNTDTLNPAYGNNPSGITLNVDRTQIFFADVEWLGVGTVRAGFVIDGAYIICHKFHHANQAGNTKVYMTTATLPIRYEITNTGATTGNSMMTQICSSIISEGGFQLSGSGNPRAASHLIGTPVRLPNDQSFKPIISIRLKSTNLDAVVIPINYSIIPVAQSLFQYRVYKKAITSGGSWVSSATDSSVEYNLAPTSLVSGDIAEQTFLNSTNQSTGAPIQEAFTFEYQLEREPFTGVAYEYLIMMATTGTNQDVYASIEWQEIS